MTAARHAPVLALLAIAFSTAAARLPLMWLPRPYGDEMMYALVGHQWLLGHPPYALLWDVKPPGLFALYAVTEALSGDPLLGPRLLPMAMVFATAVALWRLGIGWFGDARAGLIAAVVFPPFTLVLEGVMGPSRLLMLPFIAFGLIFAARRGASPALVAGLLFGAAGMINQVAVFEAVLGGLVVLFVNRSRRWAGIVPAAFYCAGGLVPIAGFAVYFAIVGHLDEFLQATVWSAAQRSQGDGISMLEGWLRFLPMLRPVLPLLVLCGFVITERRWFRERGLAPQCTWLAAWALAASAGILLLRSMYENYFLTLLPPLVLGAALFLAELQRRADSFRRALPTAGAVLGLVVFPFVWVTALAQWPTDDRDAGAIVGRLSDVGLVGGTTEPELYVADHEFALYLLTRTRQPSRFAFPQHLTCDFPLPPGVQADEELEKIMALRPRFVVISAGRSRFVCTRADRMAVIARHLEASYRLAARVGDPADPVEIFVRVAAQP